MKLLKEIKDLQEQVQHLQPVSDRKVYIEALAYVYRTVITYELDNMPNMVKDTVESIINRVRNRLKP